jgi:phage tail tape-measure protein
MSTIIAGHLQTQPQIEEAIGELTRAGFASHQIASFYVNPPGRHGAYSIGGDFDKSPGAENTGKGTAAGVAAGAAAGLAAAPVIGPLGPLVGAHLGGLVGGLSQTRDSDESSDADRPHEHREGMMIAVAIGDESLRDRAVDVLRALGAFDIEVAEGTIANGDWVDFNPLMPPRFIPGSSDRDVST